MKNTAKSRWILGVLLLGCAALPLTWLAAGQAHGEDKQDEKNLVRLIVDFSDGAEKRLNAIPWKKDMNVMDVMKFAERHRHGIKFKHKGRGATAFVRQIDDLANEGGRGKNWIYRVNGTLGTKSFAVYSLKPGDTVLWRFDAYP